MSPARNPDQDASQGGKGSAEPAGTARKKNGHLWRDWQAVSRFYSPEVIEEMVARGTVRVAGDKAWLLESWYLTEAEDEALRALTEALEKRGWKVRRQVPVPGLMETAAEAKLTLPSEQGSEEVLAEFFMPRRQPPHLVSAGAMAIHRAAGVPFLVMPKTLESESVEKRHRWLLYVHDREIELDLELDELAPRLARKLELTDSVDLHMDRPARVDRLGRKTFAVVLAKRLRRVVALREQEASADDRPGPVESAFMVHLHAPWGAGKTTVLELLGADLGKPVKKRPPWTVVRFNAWRHQSVQPPWWSLLDRVFHDALPKFWRHPLRWLRLWLGEHYRRLATGQAHIVIAIGIFLCVVAVAFYFNLIQSVPASEWLVSIAGPALTLWGAVLAFSRTLVRGSPEGARGFVRSGHDPMHRVARHFKRLIQAIGRPTLILVDDIDRCDQHFVVKLLEGVQTLLGSRLVIVVVAGDRRWLYVCYESVYRDFQSDVVEPGRRLGSLFLEKAFQMSTALPQLTSEIQGDYWRYLIGDEEATSPFEVEKAMAAARSRMSKLGSEQELIKEIDTAGNDRVLNQARRAAVVERLADQEIERGTERFLSRFAPLLEPNPRSMKRLVNAYGLMRDIVILSPGIDVRMDLSGRSQLALWAIVSIRWPLLEELVAGEPEIANLLAKPAEAELTAALEELVPKIRGDLLELLRSKQARRVFNGELDQVGVTLDADAVRRLRQVSSSRRHVE